MAEKPQEMTEEEKAKELDNKIRAPLVWAVDRRGIRIEDLQDKRFNEAIALLKEHYLTTEVTYRMLDFLNDEESVESFLQASKNQLKDKMSVVAVKEKNQDMVGVLLQRVVDKETFSRTFSRTKITTGARYNEIINYYRKIEGSNNPHEMYETRRYSKIYSIVLLPKYREKGLERLMLKCAMRAARTCNITAIVGMFASGFLQETAREAGFNQISTVFFDKYIDEDRGERIFYNPGNQNFGAMFMGRQIPEEDEDI